MSLRLRNSISSIAVIGNKGPGDPPVDPIPFVNGGNLVNSGGTLTGSYTYASNVGSLENNDPPYAINLSITNTGIGEVGDTFTCNYTFISPSNYIESGTTFQWIRKDEDGLNPETIVGATSQNYVATVDDVNHILECIVTVSQTAITPANGNPTGTPISVEDDVVIQAVAPPSRELLWTAKFNFGNTSTPAVAGYNIVSNTADTATQTFTDTNGVQRGSITNIGLWSAFIGADTSGATTGDLASDILEPYQLAGANNPEAIGRLFEDLDPSLYYRIRITSVPPTSENTPYDTFWKVKHYPSDIATDFTEVTIVPANNLGAGNAALIELCIDAEAHSNGDLRVFGRAPGSGTEVYQNSMILEAYNAPLP